MRGCENVRSVHTCFDDKVQVCSHDCLNMLEGMRV